MNNNPLSDEEIGNLSYFEKCDMLNSNPVFVARHFQCRVELFFVEILMHSNLLGNVSYYAIRVEYQFRGSPHIHSFIWIVNPPKPTAETIQAYRDFIDSTIQASLPIDDKELFELVSKYQIHKHSDSCRKYKNKACRYNYGRFFFKRNYYFFTSIQ